MSSGQPSEAAHIGAGGSIFTFGASKLQAAPSSPAEHKLQGSDVLILKDIQAPTDGLDLGSANSPSSQVSPPILAG